MPLGLSARSHIAHLDEFVYSGQVTLPEESDQLRLHCHSATSPLGLSARSPVAHLDEPIYPVQATLPQESDQLRLHCHSASAPGATLLTLTSSSTLDRSRYLRSQISSGYIATPFSLKRHQGHNARSPVSHLDELLPIIHIDELFPSTQKDELLLSTLTSPSLQFRWTGSCLLFVLMSSSPQLKRTSSHYTL